jgi:hypothetical protein
LPVAGREEECCEEYDTVEAARNQIRSSQRQCGTNQGRAWMIMDMRNRMRKYGGEDGKGRIKRGINQRVHLMI